MIFWILACAAEDDGAQVNRRLTIRPTADSHASRFHTRCPPAMDVCRQDPDPEFKDAGGGHYVACHLVH